jgi:antitoxin VapB
MTRDIAKIFMHGRSQAVRLPKAFRLPGTQVRVRRVGRTVVLEPIEMDVEAWFAELDRLRELAGGEFLPEGIPRDAPVQPEDFGWDDEAEASKAPTGGKS